MQYDSVIHTKWDGK